MPTLSHCNNKKREKRKKQTAEVFTPDQLVTEMLEKLPDEVWEKGKTYLDPACGNGNFLIQVLWIKLVNGHDPTKALKTIHGLDIKKDNIRECRVRLLRILSLYESISKEHIRIVFTNVRYLYTRKYPQGSLDYDMSFDEDYSTKTVDRWFKHIQKGELELVNLPVV